MAPAGTITVRIAAVDMRMHKPKLATRIYTTNCGVWPLGCCGCAGAAAAWGWRVAGCIGTCDADGAAAAGVGELDAPFSQEGSLARGGEGDLRAVPGPPPAPPCW